MIMVGAAAYGFQAQAPPQGSIEGQVINLKTGAPLKKATIRLSMMNSAASGRGMVISNARSVDTDDQGHFSFTGLDSGKYRLSAERQGFLRQSYGERRYSGGGTPVLVGDGQNVKGVNFKLSPQGVITGKVLDEDGEPMANVQVSVHRNLYSGGKRQWVMINTAMSSDIGEFRLPNLQPGRYLVSTNPRPLPRAPVDPNQPLPQTPDLSYAATYYPSTTDSAAAIPVDVGAGDEIRGIDVRPVKARVWRVRGKANGPGGGRGSVQVSLTPAEGPSRNLLMGVARPADGLFEIRSVPSGSYILHGQVQNGGQVWAAAQPLQVTGNHVDGIVLNLASGGDVQGIVKLTDATAPVDLGNVNVMLRPVGFNGLAPPRGRVGDDLKFTLKSVPPVKFAVTVNGYGNTCYLKSVQYNGSEVTNDGVEMTGGGALQVTLSAAAAQVDAVVMDKDDKPAIGAVVALIPKDGGTTSVFTADENGILSVRGLKPGDYRMLAWEDVEQGAPQDPDFTRKYEGRAKTVHLDPSGHEAVQLQAIPAEQ
jgi:uncharacterized surface anchored protein